MSYRDTTPNTPAPTGRSATPEGVSLPMLLSMIDPAVLRSRHPEAFRPMAIGVLRDGDAVRRLLRLREDLAESTDGTNDATIAWPGDDPAVWSDAELVGVIASSDLLRLAIRRFHAPRSLEPSVDAVAPSYGRHSTSRQLAIAAIVLLSGVLLGLLIQPTVTPTDGAEEDGGVVAHGDAGGEDGSEQPDSDSDVVPVSDVIRWREELGADDPTTRVDAALQLARYRRYVHEASSVLARSLEDPRTRTPAQRGLFLLGEDAVPAIVARWHEVARYEHQPPDEVAASRMHLLVAMAGLGDDAAPPLERIAQGEEMQRVYAYLPRRSVNVVELRQSAEELASSVREIRIRFSSVDGGTGIFHMHSSSGSSSAAAYSGGTSSGGTVHGPGAHLREIEEMLTEHGIDADNFASALRELLRAQEQQQQRQQNDGQ